MGMAASAERHSDDEWWSWFDCVWNKKRISQHKKSAAISSLERLISANGNRASISQRQCLAMQSQNVAMKIPINKSRACCWLSKKDDAKRKKQKMQIIRASFVRLLSSTHTYPLCERPTILHVTRLSFSRFVNDDKDDTFHLLHPSSVILFIVPLPANVAHIVAAGIHLTIHFVCVCERVKLHARRRRRSQSIPSENGHFVRSTVRLSIFATTFEKREKKGRQKEGGRERVLAISYTIFTLIRLHAQVHGFDDR